MFVPLCRRQGPNVLVVCKGMEFCDRTRVVRNEHAISALSSAMCQARAEETILENSPKHSSASMGAIEVASRLV